MESVEQVKIRIERLLKPDRLAHSYGVAGEARRLAAQYGADPDKAYYAGLCHDICKNMTPEEQLQWIKRSAIILDAKCKYKKGDHDNAPRFLMHALSSITKICAEQKRVIPWFVLSGGSEEELNDLIIDNREEWDGDWTE